MQKEILNSSPDADLEVFAIWFNMYPGDDHSKWPRGVLTDERVRQYWDSERVVGSWYGKHVTEGGDDHIEWDAWFLYDGDAEWTDVPKPMVDWGRTIAGTRKKLLEKITPLLASSENAG